MTISNKTPSVLSIRAGREALFRLRRDGLNAADIGFVPAAAGGPKALGLTGLDKAVFSWLAGTPRPRELVGASIGAWRMACAMQPHPSLAFDRLAACYTALHFSSSARAVVTRQTRTMLHDLFGEHAMASLLTHPDYKLSIILAQSHGPLKHEATLPLACGLIYASTLNTLSRPLLRYAFTRVICHDPRSPLAFLPHDGIPTRTVALNNDNLVSALMGTVAIPGVIEGSALPNEPGVMLRDGGLTDYHLDLPFANHGDLTLYPHFTDRIIPGWFDKFLPWRNADRERQANTILVAPSSDYLAKLPAGMLPNRSDFRRYSGRDEQRRAYWRQITAESERLGDTFLQLVESGQFGDQARPLFNDQ